MTLFRLVSLRDADSINILNYKSKCFRLETLTLNSMYWIFNNTDAI